ncbi:hypothetical protein ANAPRD1_01165 [Anaplasma phagocytophilum]|nr:hypothetical protein ANAPH1_00722 [Anaplasma phagocytophilum]SCV66609.1 hypothetical protein ANAPRD1_01165 [Anaplasma phagocytophilum]
MRFRSQFFIGISTITSGVKRWGGIFLGVSPDALHSLNMCASLAGSRTIFKKYSVLRGSAISESAVIS